MSEQEKVPRNEVSVYGQNDDALNDFPVLKAFQQYIDAEQAKARKRLLILCGFFGLLMAIVVSVFVILLREVSTKNQELNDKLVDFAMHERDRQPILDKITSQQEQSDASFKQLNAALGAKQAQTDASFKELADTLAALRKQLNEQKAKSDELADMISRRPEGATREQLALQKRLDEDMEKLRRAKALLQSEQDKVAEEKERLRKQEVELQRRKMYPEYYAEQDRKAAEEATEAAPAQQQLKQPAARPKPAAKPAVTQPKKSAAPSGPINYFDAYEDEDIDEDYDEELEDMVKALPVREPARPAASTAKSGSAKTGKSNSTVPVEMNGTTMDWALPAM